MAASFALAIAILFLSAGSAGAGLVTDKLQIKNTPTQSGNLLMVLSSDPGISPPGAAQDPRCAPIGSGEPVSVFAALDPELVPEGCLVTNVFQETLPCEGWKRSGSNAYRWTLPPGYGGACRSVVVREGRLKILCGGPQMTLALGAAQDIAFAALDGGSGTEPFYLSAGVDGSSGCRVTKDGSDGKTFLATRCTAPSTACVP